MINKLNKQKPLSIKILGFILFFLNFTAIYGQFESSNWYFGFNAGIHFNKDGTVEALTNGQLNSFEGCASISDDQGQLLFYTDGTTVYNSQHSIMENGENLYGLDSSTQSAIVIPLPENPNIYYIITAAQSFDVVKNGLHYSVVDISMDSGNGAVTLKNVRLLDYTSEKIAAVVKDCTANSIWLLALGSDSGGQTPYNTYFSFEITPAGFALPVVKSPVNDFNDYRGYLKFSSNGRKLVNADMTSGLYLYDFNVDTGVVTNGEEITINALDDTFAYGVEFSPNGNLLYVHASNDLQQLTGHTASLYQYNLLASDISMSQVVLDESRDLYRGALQLGPNGKIYRSLSETYFNGTPFLGVINNPNELGFAADYAHNAVPLNGRLAAQGLPPFVTSFNADVEIFSNELSLNQTELELCFGDELVLEATYFPGATYIWEKDDMVITNEVSHVLEIISASLTDAGEYQVTVLRPGHEACPLIAEGRVVIQPLPEVLPHVLTNCDNTFGSIDDGFGIFNLEDINEDSTLEYAFFESMENLSSNEEIENPQLYINSVPFDQYIYFKVINATGCENIGEIQLEVRMSPEIFVEPSYQICTDNPILKIDLPIDFYSYNWYRTDDGNEELVFSGIDFEIREAGDYILIVGNEYENNGELILCEQRLEFTVLSSSQAIIEDIIVTDFFEMNAVEILVNGAGDYEYSINGVEYQKSNYFDNINTGELTVYVSDKNGCGIVKEIIEIVETLETQSNVNYQEYPKFFTPNGDGINDYWQYVPPPSGEINVVYIAIFNRIGQLLIQLDPKSKGWDGSFNGRMLHETDYWFKARLIDSGIVQGHFSLIR